MPKCKTCGKDISFWSMLNYGLSCTECRATEHRNVGTLLKEKCQALIDQLGSSPLHCYATFKDVVAQTANNRAHIGDLFITSGGLVFLPYYPSQSLPGWGIGVATALAGVGAGIGGLLVMKNEQLQSLDVATKQRRKYFCASIEDRIRGNVWGEPTIIMTKKAIELVEVDSKSLLIRITHEGKHFLAAVGDAYQAKQAIDELVEGTITDRSDPECINLRIPPPQELLSIFATNRECDSALSEKLHVVSRHDEYMNTLFDEFDNKCNRIQQLTLRSLAKGPPEFARAFVRRLSDSSRQMRNYYLVGALLSLPSVVSLFWLVPLHLPGTTEEPGWLFFPDIIVIAGLFCGTFLLARGWINHHRLEALLSCVRGIALTGQFEQESLSPASELPNSAKT